MVCHQPWLLTFLVVGLASWGSRGPAPLPSWAWPDFPPTACATWLRWRLEGRRAPGWVTVQIKKVLELGISALLLVIEAQAQLYSWGGSDRASAL